MLRRIPSVICLASLILSDPVHSAEKKPSWMECLASVLGRTLLFSLMIMDHCQAATQQCEWTEQSNAEMMLDRVQCHAHPTARRLTVDHIPDDYRGDLIYSREMCTQCRFRSKKMHIELRTRFNRRDSFYIHDIRSEKGRSVNHQFLERGFDFVSGQDLMDEQDWRKLQKSELYFDTGHFNALDYTLGGISIEAISPLTLAIQKWVERVYSFKVDLQLKDARQIFQLDSNDVAILHSLHLDQRHTLADCHQPSTLSANKKERRIRAWVSFNHDRSDIVDCPLVVYDPLSFPDPTEWEGDNLDTFLHDHAGAADAYWQSQMPFGDAVIWDVERVAHHGMTGVTGGTDEPRLALALDFIIQRQE